LEVDYYDRERKYEGKMMIEFEEADYYIEIYLMNEGGWLIINHLLKFLYLK